MNFSADFQRLLPVLAVAAVAVGAVTLVVRGLAGRGTVGGSAEQALDQALGAGGQATSGKFAATLSVSLQGVPPQVAKPVSATFAGAFDRAKNGNSQLDLDGTLTAGGESFSFGMLSTGEQAFLKFRGTTYALPADRLQANGGAASASRGPLAAFGADPKGWFTNVKDGGDAEVAGVAVHRLTATLDTSKVLDDLQRVAATSGQNQSIQGATPQTIRDAVKDASVDVYVGKSDNILRKLTATGQLEGSGESGAPAVRGTVRFDLQVSAVNQPQRIRAPRGAAPVSRLDLGDLGAPGTKTDRRTKPSRDHGSRKNARKNKSDRSGARGKRGRDHSSSRPANGGGTSRRTRSGRAYVACVHQAEDLRALDKCQTLLP